MSIVKQLTAGVMTLLMTLASYASASPPSNETGESFQPVITLVPCALPIPDIASRLPWFIKAGDVICMSVRADDLRASEQARLLLIEAGARAQSANSLSHLALEYDHGVVADAEGRYSDAISHLRAAIASTN
jgi:hypothetical protein